MDRKIYEGEDIFPNHGPGATADSLIGNEKWLFDEWTERLENLFPFVEYCLPNHRWFDDAQDVKFLSLSEERPAKLAAVPKTATTPRLISEEPTCMQYMQQAIRKPLTDLLEESPLIGPDRKSVV